MHKTFFASIENYLKVSPNNKSMKDIKIVNYSNSHRQEWDDFVKEHPSTWIDSQSHWINFFEDKFGYKNYSFLIYENENLIGVMPLFLVKSIFFGKRLISGPITDIGGPFFNNLNEDVINSTLSHIDKIASEENVDLVELRCSPINLPGYTSKSEYVDFCVDLSNSLDNIWKNLNKKLRNGIRRAEKSLVIEKSNSYESLLTFYKLHLITMRSLGSPPLGFHFFEEMYKDLGKDGFFLFAKYEGKIICAIFVLIYKGIARHDATVYLPSYRHLQANSLLIFKAIKEAQQKGCKELLFGRTLQGSSVHDYKKRWNVKELSYPFYYKLYKAKKIPSDIRRSSLIILANKVWGLMPLWLTKRIGNYFRKMIAM